MVYISRCHRDLFLFLWGFTLVTKLGFKDFFPKSTWGIHHLPWELLCGQNLPSLQIVDSGFKLELLEGGTLWSFRERRSAKPRVKERVVKIDSVSAFLKNIFAYSHSCGDHIKDTQGAKASEPLCAGEVQEAWALSMVFCATFWKQCPDNRPCVFPGVHRQG